MTALRRYLGLISGTSVDTVDAVVASFAEDGGNGGDGAAGAARLHHAHAHPIPARLRRDLLGAAASARTTLARAARLDVEAGHLFAEAALAVLDAAGLEAGEIAAIGSHGQTIRHEPDERWPSTTQIGDPNVIAQRTGIATVADFRRRDVAAGGQGAPLAPAFHRAVLAHPRRCRVVVNLGGIANVTVLAPSGAGADDATIGFDSGPANGLLDAWTRRHLDAPCDRGGAWAAGGAVHGPLLERMLADPYFARPPPKSTGRGYFDEGWIDARLREAGAPQIPPADVQRTLCELCAATVQQAVEAYAPEAEEVYVCGGGVHNRVLFERLRARLAPRATAPTDALGVPADYVEAMAFAWLAMRTLRGAPGNSPPVTGATEAVVLGAIYPAALEPSSR